MLLYNWVQRFSCFQRHFEMDRPTKFTDNLAQPSEIMVSCTWVFLVEWGFLRHRVHQTWRSVHGTWPSSGRGKDLHSLGHSATHTRFRQTWFGCGLQVTSCCLSYLFWSNYGSCLLWLQVLCRCCTASWTGTCLTVCRQPSEEACSLFTRKEKCKNTEENEWFYTDFKAHLSTACTTYVRIIFQYWSVCQVLILALSSCVPSAGGQQCSR